MGSFSTSLSGVEAASQDLAVIANNLANLDTTAYKNQEANFGDFFYQMLGTNAAGDPVQIGAGTIIGSVVSNFSPGNINNTGVPTDMAIQGGGFFIEQNGSETLYTRDGDFSQNANGYLTTSDGGYVLGYPAVNGVISPTQTLAPLQISSGQISPPNATTNVELTMNLDAADQAASSGSAASGTLTVSANAAASDTVTVGGTTYTFVSSLTGITAADEVLIDPTTAANTLANLAAAINGGTGSGTTYSIATTANTSVTATAGTTTLTLAAIQAGTAGNSIATAATWALSGAATLADGASSGAATAATGTLTETANAAANDTITVGGTTYTFVASLTGVTAADQVLIDPTTAANTLANLAAAINGGTGSGTTYLERHHRQHFRDRHGRLHHLDLGCHPGRKRRRHHRHHHLVGHFRRRHPHQRHRRQLDRHGRQHLQRAGGRLRFAGHEPHPHLRFHQDRHQHLVLPDHHSSRRRGRHRQPHRP